MPSLSAVTAGALVLAVTNVVRATAVELAARTAV